MNSLKITHPLALHFLMTDDLYSLKSDELTEVATAIQSVQESDKVADEVAEISTPIISIPKLVEETVEAAKEPVVTKNEPAFFEYLGENNKYILILVNEPAHKSIDPKELETLANILKGKKQEIKDVALVNLNNYPKATYQELKGFFACNSIILFGIDPAQIKIEGTKLNRIASFQGTNILATFSIAEMLSNVDKKRAFWDEMKKL